ncbi:MAG: glycogen-binding domain-containing protein [Longimicrobiales bacterium]
MTRRTSLACILCLLVMRGGAEAQEWSLDAYAGRATYSDVASGVGATNAVLGIRYAALGGAWVYASAAAPLAASDPFWGAAGLGRRISARVGPLTLGIDLAGHGYSFRDAESAEVGAGGTLIGMPLLALGSTRARVELRSGLRQHGMSYLGTNHSRRLHDSDLRAFVRPAPMLDLGAEVRYTRAEEDEYPYAGGSAALVIGRVDVWGSAGRWLHDALPDMAWAAGARVDLGRRFDVWASVQQDITDPLYLNSPRQSWNLGLTRTLGGPDAEARTLVSAAVPATGGVTFTVPVSEAAEAPAIAGDFNQWQPVELRRSGDVWRITLPIGRGTYHYAFRAADGSWFLPSSVLAPLDDGFGGVSALLIVE